MKKTIILLLVISFLFTTSACSQDGRQKSEAEIRAEIKAELESEANINSESSSTSTSLIQETIAETFESQESFDEIMNIKDVKNGSVVSGYAVSEVSYQNDEDFSFVLDCTFGFSGALAYMETEDMFYIAGGENLGTIAMIKAGDKTMIIPNTIFLTENQIKKYVSEDVLKRLKSDFEETAACDITLKNIRFAYQAPSIYGSGGDIIDMTTIGDQSSPVSTTPQVQSNENTLLEQEGTNYYKFKANKKIFFDIDQDGMNETITYDTANGKLLIDGYKSIDIDTMFAETESFWIIHFLDQYGNDLNMIGILENGPSGDVVTTLYSIISPIGDKAFVYVGEIYGELVPSTRYNPEDMHDFNNKALNIEGIGIDSPVHLTLINQHANWYGRNTFTYYSTYKILVNNADKYEQPYLTSMMLTVLKDIPLYSDMDKTSTKTVVKAGQDVRFEMTDNIEWIYIQTEDGRFGWISQSVVNGSSFTGFPVMN